MGLFVLTVLVRVALPIEMGEVRSPHIESPLPVGARNRRQRRVRRRTARSTGTSR
jgi:hypothetical protein